MPSLIQIRGASCVQSGSVFCHQWLQMQTRVRKRAFHRKRQEREPETMRLGQQRMRDRL